MFYGWNFLNYHTDAKAYAKNGNAVDYWARKIM